MFILFKGFDSSDLETITMSSISAHNSFETEENKKITMNMNVCIHHPLTYDSWLPHQIRTIRTNEIEINYEIILIVQSETEMQEAG